MEAAIKEDTFITSLKWKEQGELIPVFDKEIFTIDTNQNKECLVIFHGFYTSSYDYHKVIQELSKSYRVIIPDFIGFGFSDKLENKYFTIIDQTDYIIELFKILELHKISILAHDYGALITNEILARQNTFITNLEIDKITICNASMPLGHSFFNDEQNILKNKISKKMTSILTSFGFFKKNIREFCFDGAKISDEILNEMWFLLERNNGRDVINFTDNYLGERKIFWNRWMNALNETNIPMKLIWGKEDPFVNEAVIGVLSENITFNKVQLIENTGRFPMLENPEEFLNCVLNT